MHIHQLYQHTLQPLESFDITCVCCTPVQYSEPPEGYFCLWFLEKIPSRYTSAFSFKSCFQEDIVCRRLDDDDRMHEAEDSMIDNPYYRIFPENPLHHGFYLSSIGIGKFQAYT